MAGADSRPTSRGPRAGSGDVGKLSSMMGGSLGAQAIVLATSPILTRIYDPAAVGMYSLYTSIAAILSVFSTLRYESAILLSRGEGVRFLNTIIVLASAAFLVLSTIVTVILAAALGVDRAVLLLPATVFVNAMTLVIPNNLLLAKDIRGINLFRLVSAVTSVGSQLALGFLGLTYLGIIIGHVIGSGLGCVLFIRRVPLVAPRALLSSRQDLRRIAFEYENFPRHMIVSGLLNRASANIAPILLKLSYSDADIGQYGLAKRVVSLPVSILVGNMADYFYREMAACGGNREALRRVVRRVTGLSVVAGGLVAALVFGVSFFAGFVFGAEWQPAGLVIRYFSLYVFFQVSFTPLCNLFHVLDDQRTYKRWEYLRLALLCAGLLAAIPLHLSIASALALYSVTMSGSYVLLLVLLGGSWRRRHGGPHA